MRPYTRRHFILTVLTTGLAPSAARAEMGGVIYVVVPYPPGGTADFLGRYLSEGLGSKWGRNIVVENRAGANTQIGSARVVRAVPDGRTLLLTSVSLASVNKANTPDLPYDAERDLCPIALVARAPTVLVVNPRLNVSTLGEFVRHAQSSSERLPFSTASTSGLVYSEILRRRFRFEALHVPYKGSAPSIMAVVAGDVAFTLESVPAVKSFLDAGKLKALLVTGSKARLEQLPDVPTADELGYPELDAIRGWWGLFGPGNLPTPLISRIHADVNEVLVSDKARDQFASAGVFPAPMSVQEFQVFTHAEFQRFERIARDLSR